MKHLLPGPMRQDWLGTALAGAFALGMSIGLAAAGLPLVGAFLALAVLSLAAAVSNTTKAKPAVSATTAFQSRSSFKTLGD